MSNLSPADYINLYAARHNGARPVLALDELAEIISDVGTLATSQQTDEEILHEMHRRSNTNAASIYESTLSYRD